MSQQSRICPSCDFPNAEAAIFCQNCGKRLEMPSEKTCPACQATIPTEARFCNQCGYAFAAEETAPAAPVAKAPRRTANKKGRAFAHRIVKSSLMLAIAICLALCAFLPSVSYSTESVEGLELERPLSIRLSVFDHMTFLFDSMVNDTAKELEGSDLYHDLEDLISDLKKIDEEDLSSSDLRTLERFIKNTLRLALRTESVSTSPSLIMPVVISLAYIALSLTLLGFAIHQFVCTLTRRQVREGRTIRLLCLAPFVILLNYMMGQSALLEAFEGISHSMSWSLMALLVTSIGIVLLLVDRYLFDRKKVVIKHMIASCTCIALAVICMFFSLGDAFAITTTGKFQDSASERTEALTVSKSFYQEFELNDYTVEQMFEDRTKLDFHSYYEMILDSSAKEYRDGEAMVPLTFAVALNLFWWSGEASFILYSAFYYVALLAALLFALLAWRATVSLYDRGSKRGGCLAFSISALIASVAALASDIVFIICFNSSLEKYGFERMMSAGIAAMPIVLTVLAIGALVVSCLLPGKEKPRHAEQTEHPEEACAEEPVSVSAPTEE